MKGSHQWKPASLLCEIELLLIFIDRLPTLDGVLTFLGSVLLGEKLWLLFTGVLCTTWEGTVGSGDLLLGVLDMTCCGEFPLADGLFSWRKLAYLGRI